MVVKAVQDALGGCKYQLKLNQEHRQRRSVQGRGGRRGGQIMPGAVVTPPCVVVLQQVRGWRCSSAVVRGPATTAKEAILPTPPPPHKPPRTLPPPLTLPTRPLPPPLLLPHQPDDVQGDPQRRLVHVHTGGRALGAQPLHQLGGAVPEGGGKVCVCVVVCG